METLLQDIRYGLRVLRKSPAFTTVAILTLALGIGANTAIFSLINAVLLKMLPVHDPAQLVVIGDPGRVHSRSLGDPRVDSFSVPLDRDLNKANNVFTGMLASGEVHRVRVAAGNNDVTSDATGVLVSGNYFSVLGVNSLYGRVFSADDANKGANPVAVLSYGFWKDKFGSNRNIIGQTVRFNNYPFTIIGVTPPGFFGDTVGDSQNFWVPLSMQEQVLSGRAWLEDYNASWLHLIGRLKPGVSAAQAKAELNLILQQLVEGPLKSRLSTDDRDNLKQAKIEVSPGGAGFSELRGDFLQPLILLTAIVALVLGIACINVANLLLARAAARRREIAVRVAIGAAPGRVVRQLLTESVVLAFAGGLVGILVAHWATRALLRLSGNSELEASPDLRVLLFTVAVCLVTGILFGMIPAWRARKEAMVPALKSGTQSGGSAPVTRWNWGKALVALQVTISLLVLFAAGLLVRSLRNMRNIDLGYGHEHLLLISTDPLAAGYNVQRITSFANQMTAELSSLPGVRSVTYSKNGLFSGSESGESIKVEGFTSKNDSDLQAASDQVGPNYFSAVGIPILLGRDIGPQDTETSPRVAVINDSMAKFYFKGMSPIGRKLSITDDKDPKRPMEIVGVAKDVRDHELRSSILRRFYIPFAQSVRTLPGVNFEIRTVGNPVSVAETARKLLKASDANVPVYATRSLNELLDRTMSNEILIARLSSVFAGLALLLACIGLYGITSYSVTGRTREIGVRMALGAQRVQVLGMVLAEAMKLVLIGMVVGIPLALVVSRLFASMLFSLSSSDPVSLLTVTLILAAIAMIAALIPARRATRVDPVVALRYE